MECKCDSLRIELLATKHSLNFPCHALDERKADLKPNNARNSEIDVCRNMSVSGGEETCNALVEGDVGTGLLTLLHQVSVVRQRESRNWPRELVTLCEWSSSTMTDGSGDDCAEKVVRFLWCVLMNFKVSVYLGAGL